VGPEQPWHKTPDDYDKPELDREIEIQAVVDLRRGIDLLLARPDVDPKRLAYVGHSYDAQWGSILSAIDKRMKTSVLMAGVAEIRDSILRGNDPGIIDFRKSRRPGQLERYAQVTGTMDAIHFVGHAAPIPLLLQFANFEEYFDKTSMEHYVAAASDPKKVLYYDTGHDLNDPPSIGRPLRLAREANRSTPSADPSQFVAESSGSLRIRCPNFVDARFARARLASVHEKFNISHCRSSD
jgi:hypothetical protein